MSAELQTSDTARYAIYFTPPEGSAFARFEKLWFGVARGMFGFARHTIPPGTEADWRHDDDGAGPAGLSSRYLANLTAEPAIYGLHATLKAPFMLAAGHDRRHLLRLARTFARKCRPVQLPRLRLDELDGFLALRTVTECPQAAALAASCVRTFDLLRAAPSAEELARRRARGLTRRQDALLSQWGYPFVFDEWRFHMTLTARLEVSCRRAVAQRLYPLLRDAVRQPLLLDAITVSVQEHLRQPFKVAGRYSFPRI